MIYKRESSFDIVGNAMLYCYCNYA